ncbi:hypothetical protein O181_076855 [Austropuccinia psidii MF-1]|uniref:FAD/NAD(P)-binding domain-containing protein n=1 Tax=Austropuccinia psidii MF-1 TaxID=1389203 RepID=A0A9Q3FH15_9BASI|nr:hypothetical protein [Austropuccinia psidii MF-1]
MAAPESKTVVVIGLGGAGLKAFTQLLTKLYTTGCNCPKHDQTSKVIVIEKSKYSYWPPGSLRASVINGFEDKVVRSYDHIVPRLIKENFGKLVKVVVGRAVVQIDFVERVVILDEPVDEFGIEGGKRLRFDYLVLAPGSIYPFPCRPPPEAKTPEELKTSMQELQAQIEQSQSILIVGAGVVGIEFAGEVSDHYPHKHITLVSSTSKLLADHNPKLAQSLEGQLLSRGIELIHGHRVNLHEAGISHTTKLDNLTKIGLTATEGSTDKTQVEADFVFLAIGNKPNTGFIPEEYLNPNNRLIRVTSSLRVLDGTSTPLPGVYALGDAIDFEGSKLFAALDGQASTVAKNLVAEMSDPNFSPQIYKPLRDTICIPLGPSGGASEILGFTFGVGPFFTSIIKGKGLFVGLFNSLYPDKDV